MNRVAELLRRAANENLHEGFDPTSNAVSGFYDPRVHTYSCNAIEHAAMRKGWGDYVLIKRHLGNLGLDCGAGADFAEFMGGPVRQSVRYAWLMFAADLAEEWDVK